VAAREPVIVGVGLSDYPVAPRLSTAQHHAQAMQRALADCGLQKRALDGYCCVGMGGGAAEAMVMAEYLGIDHRYVDSTMTGGSSFEFHVQHAAAALRQGLCEAVLVTYGSNFLSARGRTLGTGGFGGRGARVHGPDMYQAPYGLSLVGAYAMVARRHMHEFGTKPEHLAEIAVGVREFAGLNPSAMYREPITVQDVLASRMIADPLHKLDCCVVSDGGGAIVVASPEVAANLAVPRVALRGAGETLRGVHGRGEIDLTTTGAAVSGRLAFEEAGVTPADIKYASIYDSFTITVLLQLEDLGFCAKGRGGAFVADGNLIAGVGKLPFNTDGGGLCNNHPANRGGITKVIEAVRQLRGTANAPVQVTNCDLALVQGCGGSLGTRHASATLILERT
jgi:acetyl-CoA C-acetyltransferase